MSAENAFRDAFTRLKSNTPNNIPSGSKVSQNNVAREAGLDPSALKKSRFPELVLEIQTWVTNNHELRKPSTIRQKISREQKRDLRQQITDLRVQRDHLACLLVEADSVILKLQAHINKIESSDHNVESLHKSSGNTFKV